MHQTHAGRVKGLLLATGAAACWSTSGIFTTYILAGSSMTAWELAFWRELSTLLVLLTGLALWQPDQLRADRRDMPWLAGMGISMGLLHISWNASILENGVAVATVFQYNSPILVAILAWLVWREPLTGRKVTTIALATIGTGLIVRLGRTGVMGISGSGLLAGAGTAVSYSAFTLFGKKVAANCSPWTVNFYIFLFAFLTLAPIAIGAPLPWPLSGGALLSLVGIVLFTTILGYALYTVSLRHLQASVAVIVSTAEVPFATILAYTLLGQRLDGWQMVGALLVISSVVLLYLHRNPHRENPTAA